MNARLYKETRELMPALGITLLMMWIPMLIWGQTAAALPLVALALGSAIMGGITFGSEFQARTFAVLLAQPIPRSRVWLEKMGVLAAGLIICVAGLRLCYGEVESEAVPAFVLIPACAFAGAPLLTLLSRNGIAGTVFSIALPGALLSLCLGYVVPRLELTHDQGARVAIATMTVYCAAACWAGYRCFLRAEALDAGGGEIGLPPAVDALLRRAALVGSGRGHPFLALFRKELRLQQVSFLFAVVFILVAVLTGGAVLLRPENREWAEWVLGADFIIFLGLVPFLVGAVGFAEERAWGVSDWHLTLPISAFLQWSVKSALALALSVGFGVVLPIALVWAGTLILPGVKSENALPPAEGVVLWIMIQMVATSLAVHAGSLTNSTLKGMLLGLAGACGIGILLKLSTWLASRVISPGVYYRASDPAEMLCAFSLLAGLVGVLQWLAFRNFREPGVRPRTRIIQFLGIASLAWAIALTLCLRGFLH
jgi:hypothetical protein